MAQTIRVKFLDTGEVRDVVPDGWTDIPDRSISSSMQARPPIGREPYVRGYRLVRLMETRECEFMAEPIGGQRGFLR